MPAGKHLKGASGKRQRQYEHIKESAEEKGKSSKRAKEIAARTVNKQRKQAGETKAKKKYPRKLRSEGILQFAASKERGTKR